MTDSSSDSQPYINAHRSGDIMWLDMIFVPEHMRGRGIGRALYEQWEQSLPDDVTLVLLMAADTGSGVSDSFWDALGFNFRYTGEDLDYESQQYMWRGVNGHPTPPTIDVDDIDEDDMEDDEVSDSDKDISKKNDTVLRSNKFYDKLDSILKEGHEAFRQGIEKTESPYKANSEPHFHNVWIGGWAEAKIDSMFPDESQTEESLNSLQEKKF